MNFKVIVVILFVVITGAVVGYGIWLADLFPEKLELEKTGLFGDSFGVLTSLFSGLAFLGIIITIYIQSRELALQRKEIAHTRQVLVDQKKELENQNTTQKQQRFETTFFNMLELNSDSLNQVRRGKYEGRDAIEGLVHNSLFSSYAKVVQKAHLESMILNIKATLAQQNNELSHYYKMLKVMMEFIDKSDLDDKDLYFNILFSRMSEIEIKFFHLIYVSDPYGLDFIYFVDKYKLTNFESDKFSTLLERNRSLLKS